VVGEEEREGGEEGGGEPPPDAWHDGEHPGEGERVALGGVDGGDGEDGGGDGEEREEEEGEEVGGLEEEEGEPVGGEAGQQRALRVGARGGGVERGVVGVDVGEERVRDGDVEEEERGEGQDEGPRDAREERAVLAAEDLRGEAVDAYDAQELQLLRLAIHGWDGIWWWVDGWMDWILLPAGGVGLGDWRRLDGDGEAVA